MRVRIRDMDWEGEVDVVTLPGEHWPVAYIEGEPTVANALVLAAAVNADDMWCGYWAPFDYQLHRKIRRGFVLKDGERHWCNIGEETWRAFRELMRGSPRYETWLAERAPKVFGEQWGK